MLTQEVKDRAKSLYDNGNWWKLAMLIIEMGTELIKYLRELRAEKRKKPAQKTKK